MTKRERILAVYRNQLADQIPLGCYSMFNRLAQVPRFFKGRNFFNIRIFNNIRVLCESGVFGINS